MSRSLCPAVSEVQSEEILKHQRAEEKSASSNVPDPVTPQTLSPEQKSPVGLTREGESVGDIEENVVKTDTVSLPVEDAGLNPAPLEETQVKDQIPNASGESTGSEGGDTGREIAAMRGNPHATP